VLAGHRHHVAAKLLGIGLGHCFILTVRRDPHKSGVR
jgi:hypothetical protein